MKALRVVWLNWRLTPLQNWIAVVAVATMILGCFASAQDSGAFFFLGAMLLVMFPAILAGVGTRLSSAGNGMRLRPAAYLTKLRGALLTITILTALNVGPILVATYFGWIGPIRKFPLDLSTLAGAAHYALLVWSIMGAVWLGTFFLVHFPLTILAVIFLPPVIGAIVGLLPIDRDHLHEWLAPLQSLQTNATIEAFALLVAGAWIVFSIWFLRGPRMPSPGQRMAVTLRRSRAAHSVVPAIVVGQTRAAGIRAWLGAITSWPNWRISSVILLAIQFLLVLSFSHLQHARFVHQLEILLYAVCSVTGAIPASSMMSRARFLWLRAGVQRVELFGIVERLAIQRTLASMLAYAVGTFLMAVLFRTDDFARLLGSTAVAAALALASLYAVLTFVGPRWSVRIVVMSLCFAGAQLIRWSLLPAHGADAAQFAITAGACLALAMVLRGAARWRWRRIDWLLLRPFSIERYTRMRG